jgi:hypothetical protein
VGFNDPLTGRVRSIPTAWTDLATVDPFVLQAKGRAILRLVDLQALVGFLETLADALQLDTQPIIDSPDELSAQESEGGER